MDIPQYLRNELDGEALIIFEAAASQAESQGLSPARQYVAGFFALKDKGYQRGPNGKFQLARKEADCVVELRDVKKADDDKRQVFGFFSVVEVGGVPVVDRQGDAITAKDLEESVYKYMKFSRMGDERHDGRCKAVLIESMFFSKEKQEALGIDLGFVGWWGGFEIIDPSMWEKVKAGEYKSFSIGGAGRRERVDS